MRDGSVGLTRGLEVEDMVVQSMPDVSPTRWHLAHQSWFFQVMVLGQEGEGGKDDFVYLFNSYYNAVGEQFPRPRRGLMTRPTVREVLEQRGRVDAAVRDFVPNAPEERLQVLELGLHHEQQHQELMLTDLHHVLAQNPLLPAAYAPPQGEPAGEGAQDDGWLPVPGGLHEIGHSGPHFAFDSEGPRHQVLVRDAELAAHPVTNAQYLAFVQGGGYGESRHWHSDGWSLVQREGWRAPLYWHQGRDDSWRLFSLHGPIPLQPQAPVANLSWFEASAYASWKAEQTGQPLRLPSEQEWELCARQHWPQAPQHSGAQLADPMPAQWLTPVAGSGHQGAGQVWEWTSSSFAPYPGFVPAQGALGEYNGKFMSGQMVLRGGSCLSPRGHLRHSYRNFFPPHSRWQMSGLRLARDPS